MHKFRWILLLFATTAFWACTKTEDKPTVTGVHVFNEVLDAAHPTSDGGFIYSSHQGNLHFISKLDKNGQREWSRMLQPFQQDYNFELASFRQVSNGEYLVSATAIVDNIYNRIRAYLIRMDAGGNFLWVKQIDSLWTAGSLTLDDAIQGKNGKYYVSGIKKDLHNSNSFLITVDIPGNTIRKDITNYNYTNAFLYEAKDTSLWICGKYTTQPLNFLLKYYHGAEQGFYILNVLGKDRFVPDMLEEQDGGICIGGNSDFTASKTDFFIQKVSSSGSIEFTEAKTQTNNNYCSSVIRSVDGGYLFAGTSSGDSTANGETVPTLSVNTKMILMKLDAGRNIKWSYVYGGNYGSEGIAVSQTNDGILIIGNQVNPGNLNSANMIAIKTKNNGQVY